MIQDDEHQGRLAAEYICSRYCADCKFYAYNKEDEVCLFHSAPKEECTIVMLDYNSELPNDSTNKNTVKK